MYAFDRGDLSVYAHIPRHSHVYSSSHTCMHLKEQIYGSMHTYISKRRSMHMYMFRHIYTFYISTHLRTRALTVTH